MRRVPSLWLANLASCGCRGYLVAGLGSVVCDSRDQFRADAFRVVVLDLAGARVFVPASALAQHQLADVESRTPIEDRLANREYRVCVVLASQHVHRDPCFGEQGVDHEAVAGKDGDLVAEIQDDEVPLRYTTALELSDEIGLLLLIERDAFLDVGNFENLFDVPESAVVDQIEHQLLIRRPEGMEASESGAGIH